MSKEACDSYIEMYKKLISMPMEWQDTDEGNEHLDKMDIPGDDMTEDELKKVQKECGRLQREADSG